METLYFVEMAYGLNPQNKLQAEAERVLRKLLHQTVTTAPDHVWQWVKTEVELMNSRHPRSRALTTGLRWDGVDEQTRYIDIGEGQIRINIKHVRGSCLHPPAFAGKPHKIEVTKLDWKYE